MTNKHSYSLLNNSRFYVLTGSVLLSLVVLAITRIVIPSDQLYIIRLQQLFGVLCLVYWYIALIISPLGYIIGKQRLTYVEFTRRAIGVSAFYFALLHAGIALWGQLGGLGSLQHLPELFIWSLVWGITALAILGIMAATSFDRVVQYMTRQRWKWLHRLVYIAFVLVVLHIWSIGTHLAYSEVQLLSFVMLVLLGGLELYKAIRISNEKYLRLNRVETFTLFLASWASVIALILAIPAVVQNYHSRHTDHSEVDR